VNFVIFVAKIFVIFVAKVFVIFVAKVFGASWLDSALRDLCGYGLRPSGSTSVFALSGALVAALPAFHRGIGARPSS